ncbi:MAG: hypothetical protein JWQ07_5907 [Ramlibacter sp.]|nr:hypothetical protein [Ramlibacter sp.]
MGAVDDGLWVLGAGELMVVETEDDWFLGTVELTADGLAVRNGFVGRPRVLAPEEVLRVVPAAGYLDPQRTA